MCNLEPIKNQMNTLHALQFPIFFNYGNVKPKQKPLSIHFKKCFALLQSFFCVEAKKKKYFLCKLIDYFFL